MAISVLTEKRLKQSLAVNERLKAKLDDIFSAVTTTGEGFPSTSFKNSGISELDVGRAGLSIALPDAYVDFLKYANGEFVLNGLTQLGSVGNPPWIDTQKNESIIWIFLLDIHGTLQLSLEF